jgi:O-antigen/teichoic acid export membrane protein
MIKFFLSLLNSKKFKNLIIYGFGQIFNLLTPLLLIPFIVDKCGEENFGKTAISFSIYIFFISFIDFCSDLIGVKEISENRKDTKHLSTFISKFLTIKVFILALSVFILVVLIKYNSFFIEERKLYIFGMTILIGQCINPTWILQGLEKFKLLTFLNILSKTIYLLGVFFFLKAENDYFMINFWFGFGTIISSLIIWFLLITKYNLSFIVVNKIELLKYVNNNKGIVFSQIFVWFQLYAVVLIINFLGTKLEVGQFRIVDQVITIFRTFAMLSFNFLFPGVCYDFSINKKSGLKKWKTLNGAALLLVTTICVFLFLFSYEVIAYFNVTNVFLLSNLLKIYLVFPILHYTNIALKQLLLANNLNKTYVKITIFTTVLNVICMYILFKTYSLYGIIYSFIFVECLLIILSIIILKKKSLENK